VKSAIVSLGDKLVWTVNRVVAMMRFLTIKGAAYSQFTDIICPPRPSAMAH
jgi:hypothetical protein